MPFFAILTSERSLESRLLTNVLTSMQLETSHSQASASSDCVHRLQLTLLIKILQGSFWAGNLLVSIIDLPKWILLARRQRATVAVYGLAHSPPCMQIFANRPKELFVRRRSISSSFADKSRHRNIRCSKGEPFFHFAGCPLEKLLKKNVVSRGSTFRTDKRQETYGRIRASMHAQDEVLIFVWQH